MSCEQRADLERKRAELVQRQEEEAERERQEEQRRRAEEERRRKEEEERERQAALAAQFVAERSTDEVSPSHRPLWLWHRCRVLSVRSPCLLSSLVT